WISSCGCDSRHLLCVGPRDWRDRGLMCQELLERQPAVLGPQCGCQVGEDLGHGTVPADAPVLDGHQRGSRDELICHCAKTKAISDLNWVTPIIRPAEARDCGVNNAVAARPCGCKPGNARLALDFIDDALDLEGPAVDTNGPRTLGGIAGRKCECEQQRRP